MTYRQLVKSFVDLLCTIYPKTEVDNFVYIIFEHENNWKRIDVHENYNNEADASFVVKFEDIKQRLLKHEPIQYILGTTFFYDYNFNVAPGILIPRPETEELIDLIVKTYKQAGHKTILDVGTGSGCIAISLDKQLPNAKVYALDVSDRAIEIANSNIDLNDADIILGQADVLAWDNQAFLKNSTFDIIVSNPPYIPYEDKKRMEKNVLEYEPELALFVPDNDPLLFYRTIAQMAVTKLNQNGALYFEINEDFGNELVDLLSSLGYSDVKLISDLNGKHRIVSAKK